MNFLPQSRTLGEFRTRLLSVALGALVSTLAGGALADVACSLSGGPYQAGVPVQLSASNNDELGFGHYTVLWGDGTTTSGSAISHRTPPYGEFFYQHNVAVSHVYSGAESGISIAVQLNGESCTTQAFDVLAGSASSAPPMPKVEVAVEYYHSGWNMYFVTALSNEIAALDAGAFGGVWTRTGQQFNVYALEGAPAFSSPVWRFSGIYALKSAHVYTASQDEYDDLTDGEIAGWSLEGPVFSAPLPAGDGTCPAGTIPVYRLYNNASGGAPNQRLITDANEFSRMTAAGWTPEGEGVGVGLCSPQ